MRRFAPWMLLLAAGACEPLDAIELGLCGNGVIDAGEDCDGFAHPEGTSCAAAGATNACRYVCDRACEGNVDCVGYEPCPLGWGCGLDGVCRAPAGEFEPSFEAVGLIAGAWLGAADLNRDGYDDVIAGQFTAIGTAFRGPRGAPSDTSLLPLTPVGYPALSDVDGDSFPDVIVPSIDGLAVLRGTNQTRLSPSIYPSLLVPTQRAALVRVDLLPATASPGDELVAYTGDAFYRPALDQLFLAAAPGGQPIQTLVGRPAVGQLDATTYAQEIVVAHEGQGEVRLFHIDVPADPDDPEVTSLAVDLAAGEVAGPAQPPTAAEPVRQGVWVLNANPATDGGESALCCDVDCTLRAPADEHLDLVVATTAGLAVSFGQSDGTFHSDPCTLGVDPPDGVAAPRAPLPTAVGEDCIPLAVAHLDGDGLLDVVTASGIHLSSLLPLDQELCEGDAAVRPFNGWIEAEVGDVNADGHADVITTNVARGDLDVILGSSTEALGVVVVPQTNVSRRLRLGDFDGDGAMDAVVVQPTNILTPQQEQLAVLWGKPGGTPSEVANLGQVPVVRDLAATSQTSLLEEDTTIDTFDDLAIVVEEFPLDDNGNPDTDSPIVKYGELFGRSDRQLMLPFRPTIDDEATETFAMFLPTGVASGNFDFASNEEALAAVMLQFVGSDDILPEDAVGVAAIDLTRPDTTGAPGGTTVPTLLGPPTDLQEPIPDEAIGQRQHVVAARIEGDTDQLIGFAFHDGEWGLRVHVPRYGEASWEAPAYAEVDEAIPIGALPPIDFEAYSFAALSPFIPNTPVACNFAGDGREHVALAMVLDQPGTFVHVGDPDVPEPFLLSVQGQSVAYVYAPDDLITIRDGGTSVAPVVIPSTEAMTAGVACVDIDGDGRDELLMLSIELYISSLGGSLDESRAGYRTTIEVARYLPNGEFAPLEELIQFDSGDLGNTSDAFNTLPAQGMVRGDFDGDGITDLAIGAYDDVLLLYGKAVNP